MKRILLLLLPLLIAVVVTGCDLLDPTKGGGSNPPDEKYGPMFENVSVSDKSWMFIPGPGRFVRIEADIRVEDGLKSVSVVNHNGEVKADTVLSEPVQSLSFIREIEIKSMADGRLTITAEGKTGMDRHFLSLNVKEELILSLGQENGSYGLFQLDWEGGVGQAVAQKLFTFSVAAHQEGFGISPDGSHFLVFDYQPASNCTLPLILNYRGEVVEAFEPNCNLVRPKSIVWRPDGKEVSFIASDNGLDAYHQAFTFNLESGEVRLLTEGECSPSFNPTDEPGGDTCFKDISGLGYTAAGELYATRIWRKGDEIFADLARLSTNGGSHQRIVEFPVGSWVPSLKDIEGNLTLFDVDQAKVGERYGTMLLDLNNPEGYTVKETEAYQFSFSKNGGFLGVYVPKRPSGAPDRDIVFYDRGGTVVAGPYWVPIIYLSSPRLITTEKVGTLL